MCNSTTFALRHMQVSLSGILRHFRPPSRHLLLHTHDTNMEFLQLSGPLPDIFLFFSKAKIFHSHPWVCHSLAGCAKPYVFFFPPGLLLLLLLLFFLSFFLSFFLFFFLSFCLSFFLSFSFFSTHGGGNMCDCKTQQYSFAVDRHSWSRREHNHLITIMLWIKQKLCVSL